MMDNVLDNLNFSDNLILVANSVDNTMTHTTLITNLTDFPGSNMVRAAKLIYNMRMKPSLTDFGKLTSPTLYSFLFVRVLVTYLGIYWTLAEGIFQVASQVLRIGQGQLTLQASGAQSIIDGTEVLAEG